MITREEYIKALKIVEGYHKQTSNLEDRTPTKTKITEWKYYPACGPSLLQNLNILMRRGKEYIEDVSEKNMSRYSLSDFNYLTEELHQQILPGVLSKAKNINYTKFKDWKHYANCSPGLKNSFIILWKKGIILYIEDLDKNLHVLNKKSRKEYEYLQGIKL